MKLMLKNVRLAFPSLFAAKAINGEGEPKFSAAAIFPPGHPAEKELKAAIESVGSDKWGTKWGAVKKEIEAKDRTALHDGGTKADYEGYEGNLFLNASNKTRPLVLDADRAPLVEADGKPYAGCYVNMSVELWAQDNQYGKRINASLRGVQFLRDGDAFAGGGAASEDEFEDLSAGADAALV